MNDSESEFLALVEDETLELADEFRAQGARAVDEAFIRLSVWQRRQHRERGRFVVFCQPNGNIGMEWMPDRWQPFWESLDQRESA